MPLGSRLREERLRVVDPLFSCGSDGLQLNPARPRRLAAW